MYFGLTSSVGPGVGYPPSYYETVHLRNPEQSEENDVLSDVRIDLCISDEFQSDTGHRLREPLER